MSHEGQAESPTIIVPLDGTDHARVALPVARELAALMGAVLHVVHIAERPAPPRDRLRELGLDPARIGHTVLDERRGSPGAGVLDVARELGSSMVVICPYTGLERPARLLGHVADEVLRRAECPVVLVDPRRGTAPWHLRRVLLPHDGTPTSAAAFVPAADLALRAGARVDVLHVATPGEPVEQGTMTAPRYVDHPEHEWPQWAAEFLARLRARSPGPADLHLYLTRGEPGPAILRFAAEHDVDLVVLASRGTLEPARAATTKAVIRDAPCPVMVVHVPPA